MIFMEDKVDKDYSSTNNQGVLNGTGKQIHWNLI